MPTSPPADLPHPRIPVEEARALVVGAVRRVAAEPVGLAELAGRVLAAPVVAPHDLPRHANSAMDGYALRAGEPGPWPVAARILAGDDPVPLPAGACAAIATGGVLPAGADAVVPIEQAEDADGVVTATAAVTVGDHVRPVGADVRAGDEVLPAGAVLGHLAAAAVAGLGLTGAACAARPRVAILTTGDELVAPGEPLARGQIHESNSVLVRAALERAGCAVVHVGGVPDAAAATRDAFAGALAGADLVVSTGGVSVGPRDHVKPALAALGVRELFWRIATQPGQPTWCGTAPDGTLVAGLPGNPLSCLVGLHLLLVPAVRAMMGADPGPETVRAELAAPVRRLPARMRCLPMRLVDGRLEDLGAGVSHQLSRAARANALALVPAGEGELAAGAPVDAVVLG
ncbi:MAG: gephyrin-like molybdotransferase Glp [Actinomycetota bacterium]